MGLLANLMEIGKFDGMDNEWKQKAGAGQRIYRIRPGRVFHKAGNRSNAGGDDMNAAIQISRLEKSYGAGLCSGD